MPTAGNRTRARAGTRGAPTPTISVALILSDKCGAYSKRRFPRVTVRAWLRLDAGLPWRSSKTTFARSPCILLRRPNVLFARSPSQFGECCGWKMLSRLQDSLGFFCGVPTFFLHEDPQVNLANVAADFLQSPLATNRTEHWTNGKTYRWSSSSCSL